MSQTRVDDFTAARLHEILERGSSSDWGNVGKAIGSREESETGRGRFEEGARRIRGGWFEQFPELTDGPTKAVKAIRKGKGVVYRRIVKQAREFILPFIPRTRARKLPSVAGHESVTRKCKLCHLPHSKKQHRFHGSGSFHRTHLWGFSMNARRKNTVARQWKRALTLYKRYKTETAEYRALADSFGLSVAELNKRLWDVMHRDWKKGQVNPSPAMPLLYGQVKQVLAKKTQPHRCDSGCRKVDHCYYHDFKPGAKEWGLPEGAVLILPGGKRYRIPLRSLLIAKSLKG